MTPIAPHLQAFFTERLARQRQASPNTVAAYSDAFRLLLRFARQRLGTQPSDLVLEQLDAVLIGAFLDHLETVRECSSSTRNARLAAIHSFYRFLALRLPAHGELIQRVLAIPQKRTDRDLVDFLTREEVEALLAAPDTSTWVGRRDHALLLFAIQTGLRVSELTDLRLDQLVLTANAYVRCRGKGRKERVTPLAAQTLRVLQAWIQERKGSPEEVVFPSVRGGSMSRDAVEIRLAKHAATAETRCSSLRGKRVSPHVLRHTTAVQLLQAGVDRSTIALWLGHQSVATTQMYLDADLAMKEAALAKLAPMGQTSQRFRADDRLLVFLKGL